MKTEITTMMIAAVMATGVSAFWGTGHLIVSRRAQAILESNDQQALDQALQVLSTLKASEPSLTSDEDQHPFTECATFADNIKGQGYSGQSDWHFIDQPYLDQAGTTIDDYPDYEMSDVDVVAALTDLTAFLKGDSVSSSSPYLIQLQDWFEDESDQKSFALRLVIHYVGDIHQPLHAVSEVDDKFPEGDRGGNDEWIPNVSGVGNLHALWDSVIYEYTGYPDLPLSDSDWDSYTKTASDLASSYPIKSDDVKSSEFEEWAQESLTVAQTIVYPDFVFNEPVSDEYENNAKPVIEERLMFGGARLAALIQDIYGASSEDKDVMLEFTDMVLEFLQ